MKRHAWWGVGLCVSMGLAACSGSEGDESGPTDDAGIGDFRDDLAQLRDQLNQLGPQLDQLDMRTTVLETPKTPGSCSAGELCIPDGIDLAKAGLQPIIAALCTRETTCCNAGELNYLYGVAVKTAADCEAVFADMIGNGLTYSEGVFGESVETIVRAAHALNDTDVLVEVDATAVAACAAEIGATVCPDADQPESEGCVPELLEEESACSISKLLKGKEREGDTCEPGVINECGDGLVCRPADGDGYNEESYYEQGQSGICAPKAAVGDRCTRHADCDDLYCDFAVGTCRAYSLEGEPCAFIDPTFENSDVDPILDEGHYTNNTVTNIDCAVGLTCNPLTNTCVKKDCAAGSWCNYDYDCGTGLTCNWKANAVLEAYADNWGNIGVCTTTLADGSECYEHTNCASGFCNDGTCEPKVASGGTCYVHEQCPTNEVCQDGTCVAPVARGAACGPVEDNLSNCPRDTYCYSVNVAGTEGRCLTGDGDLPDGAYCNGNSFCASNFCRYNDSLCATPVAIGTACDPQEPYYMSPCGSEAYCKVGATPDTGACTPYSQPGEACDPALNGRDCHNQGGSACQLRHESFMCAPWSGTKTFCGNYGGQPT